MQQQIQSTDTDQTFFLKIVILSIINNKPREKTDMSYFKSMGCFKNLNKITLVNPPCHYAVQV